MEKISFYGLSGSGKSCYTFAMAQALSQGIRFNDGQVLTVRCPIPMQMAKLHRAYQQMINGQWPAGNVESVNYNFNCRLALTKLMDFGLKDYRGGLLDTCDEDEMDEQDELFGSFEDSSVLLFFIGADTIKLAMNGDYDQQAKIDFMGILYESFLDRTNDSKTPLMIVISKSDLLTDSEKNQAKDFVYNTLQSMFSTGTELTAAITMVTLGKNLSNDQGELEGELIIGPTQGNIHIPIVYSLFCVISNRIEESIGKLTSAQNSFSSAQKDLSNELKRSAFARFFSSNENRIRNRISESNKAIGEEKNILNKLSETLSKLKPLLLRGADVYISGIKQQ